MRSLLTFFMFVVLGCQTNHTGSGSPFLIGLEFDSGRPDFLEEMEVITSLENSSLIVERYDEDRDNYDFILQVVLNEYLGNIKFIELEYTLYYKNTLNSVTLNVDIDGEISDEKIELALRILKDQTLNAIHYFPEDLKHTVHISN